MATDQTLIRRYSRRAARSSTRRARGTRPRARTGRSRSNKRVAAASGRAAAFAVGGRRHSKRARAGVCDEACVQLVVFLAVLPVTSRTAHLSQFESSRSRARAGVYLPIAQYCTPTRAGLPCSHPGTLRGCGSACPLPGRERVPAPRARASARSQGESASLQVGGGAPALLCAQKSGDRHQIRRRGLRLWVH